MYILDTDHISVLERGGASALALTLRLDAVPENDIVTTVITYQEQCKGWLDEINAAKPRALVSLYEEFRQQVNIYCNLTILAYDDRAHQFYTQLRAKDKQIGTQDLRIAAIALANDATVLTRNTRHFSRVPGLRIEDWTA